MDADVVIIGGGLAGAASAWSLARRGRSVILVEQFAAGHEHGSSHGSSRIVRRAYEDALYVSLTGQAFELWREVELATGQSLLRMLGGLDFGSARGVDAMAAHLRAAAVPYELLPAAEAAARWPGLVFDGEVLFHPQAGTLDAAAAVTAFITLATALGTQVRYCSSAVSVSPSGLVTLGSGETLSAAVVVIAAGAWLESLVGPGLELPPLRVKEQTIYHFPRLDPTQPPWPSVIHETETAAIYHLAGGRDGGSTDDRKMGDHFGGRICSAASRSGQPDPALLDRLTAYIGRWLPGLGPTPTSAATCLYTMTPSEDFIVDRVGPVIVCSPCSGHGAKFAPVVGELVASLACSSGSEVPSRFALAAHRSRRSGAVSL